VYVKNSYGMLLKFKLNSTDTIDDLKEQIEDAEDIPPDQMSLHFGGRQLESGRTFAYYNFPTNITIANFAAKGC
jgi:ubiquitin